MYTYKLIQNGKDIYYDDDANVVVHEMLSMILQTVIMIKENNMVGQLLKSNLYINIDKKTDNNKKYPITVGTLSYDFNANKIITQPDMNFKLENYNEHLINSIKNAGFVSTPILQVSQHAKLKNPLLTNYENLEPTKTITLDQNVNSNSNTDNIENIDEEIMKLERLKTEKEQRYIELCETHNKKKEDLIEEECTIRGNKMLERIRQEKEKEKKRIFDADKFTYNKMKSDIMENKLLEENISILFKQKYYIIKFMDENNHLDADYDFKLFTELFVNIYPKTHENDEFRDHYISLNYNYLSEEQQNKCKTFVNKNINKIPSYDDLVMELSENERQELVQNSGIGTIMEHKNVPTIGKLTKIFKNNLNAS